MEVSIGRNNVTYLRKTLLEKTTGCLVEGRGMQAFTQMVWCTFYPRPYGDFLGGRLVELLPGGSGARIIYYIIYNI